MRVVIFGTGPFAVPTFAHLAKSDHTILAVVTRPIQDSGNRRKTAENPVRDLAVQLGYEIWDPADANDPAFVDKLRSMQSDLLFVCDFGQILSADCLATARLGGINLHGSLLPRYRGAAPINWAIYHGDPETGVTVIHMTPRMDAGPALAIAKTNIGPDETAVDLEPRLAQLGVQAVVTAIDQLEQWDGQSEIGQPQDASLVTGARRLRKNDGWIDWTRSASEIVNQIRAFQPWPGSFTEWHGAHRKPVRLILHRGRIVDQSYDVDPGQVAVCDKQQLTVQTGQGGLQILTIQPAGKRPMEIADFLRGYQPAVGDQMARA